MADRAKANFARPTELAADDVRLFSEAHDVPHLWNVDDHAHAGETWGSNLHHFAQRIFR